MDNSVYGSGILHAWVKNAAGDTFDINAIMGVDGNPEMEETEIPGDDEIKVTFRSNQKFPFTLTANAITMDAFAAMTGNPVTSVAAVVGPPAVPARKEIPGGTEVEKNSPFVEIGAVTNGKAQDGSTCHIIRVWHRVQCRLNSVPQQNGSEVSAEFECTAYPTSTDIEGDALASRRTDTTKIIDGAYAG